MTTPGARNGEVKRITPNSRSSRSIRRLHMKHETANLAHYLNLVTNDTSCRRSMIPVRSTARTSWFALRIRRSPGRGRFGGHGGGAVTARRRLRWLFKF
jgi:hypothetical protein